MLHSTTKVKKKVKAIKPGISLSEVEDLLCEKSLRHFLAAAWPTIEPKPFKANWHIDAVCEHLEAVSRGQLRHLVINIPPRHTKSLTVSVSWPAWEWGPFSHPETRWLFMSYASGLSIRDSVKCRTLIQSQWYQSRWGSKFHLMGDQNAKERYNNNKHGYRIASSVGGIGTGEGGDRLVIDDPHNVADVHSETSRESVVEWWDTAMSTRSDDPKAGARVVIMQRSHHADLVGHIKDTTGNLYEYLILPAEYEPKRHCVTSLGFSDPRSIPGDILWPGRFDKKELKDLKSSLGSAAYEAQCQQNPTPIEGGMFKRHWWKFYECSPYSIAEECDFIYQSWDMTFKETAEGSYVVGQVWGLKKGNSGRYLLDQVRERMGFSATKRAVRNLSAKWPKATAKYIEDKANGPAIQDELKNELTGIIPFPPTGSKEERADACTPEVEAGNVYLPHPKNAPWVDDYIEEHAQFNKGPHNDQVDATSQALAVAKKKMQVYTHLAASIVSTTKASGLTDHRSMAEVWHS